MLHPKIARRRAERLLWEGSIVILTVLGKSAFRLENPEN